MSDYAIFFDKNGTTYRLPVNPSEVEVSSAQAIEKYEVLKIGQVAIPTHMELKEFSFECELPKEPSHYTETTGGFRDPDSYLNLFSEWRESLEPVRFIASNGIGDDTNTLVLIEELTITERAGEEGDKYVSFQLLEYKEFGKKSVVVATPQANVAKKVPVQTATVNPKSNGSYTVASGDSLWAIAKKMYGDGDQYPKIASANKTIKNPSLIYPGQKLVIPT
ncbi:MAG: LysM peptidoglycan-binding domain-containing protein [Desulfitobacterium sp.]